MMPPPAALFGAFVTLFLAALGGAASLGALFWRMRAAEARLRGLEEGAEEAQKTVSSLTAQLAGLASTIEALSRNVEALTRLLRGGTARV